MSDDKAPLTEADLAACVVRYFSDNHWQVYQEVQLYQGSNRADIVVTQGKLVGVIECKQALGLPVLEQAWEWRQHAHLIWVATWARRVPPGRLLWKVTEEHGIGVLQQSMTAVDNAKRQQLDPFDGVSERLKPALLRSAPQVDMLRAALRPEHQTTCAAGSSRGGHWTPFKQTCSELERIVRVRPGITLREALGEFKHHYSNTRSAICNLPEWIDKGKVPGVRLDRSDGKLRLWITTDPA
jgi:hypothetical protein